MIAKVKLAKKPQAPAPESDSDSASDLSDNDVDEQHMSDEEFPMSEDEQIQDNDEDGEEEEGPSKWALTMAKYLRKAGDAHILSKAVKDVDLEKKRMESKTTYKFEVVGEQKPEVAKAGDEKDVKPGDLQVAQELLRQRALLKKERQKDILGLRIKPSIGQYEREKALKKIATRGTVQLFNAVRQQQRDVNKKLDDAGNLEYKREKVLKNLSKKEFLNVLMSGPRAKSELVDNLVKKEEDEVKDEIKSEEDSNDDDEPESTWGALRADFLTGKKSGWDKEDDDKEDSFGDGNGGASSDSD